MRLFLLLIRKKMFHVKQSILSFSYLVLIR